MARQTALRSQELHITTGVLPVGAQKTPYTASLRAAGGAPPYRWALLPGETFPFKLTLSPDGSIAGKPGAHGTATRVVTVTDSAGASTQAKVSISVTKPY